MSARSVSEEGALVAEREPALGLAEAETDVDALQQEYRAWREEAGLAAPAFVELRLRRWQRLLVRQCGVLFAPWSVWEE